MKAAVIDPLGCCVEMYKALC